MPMPQWSDSYSMVSFRFHMGKKMNMDVQDRQDKEIEKSLPHSEW
jgi:hypothetical protein